MSQPLHTLPRRSAPRGASP